MQLTKTRTYTRTLYLGSPCLFHCIGKDSSRVMAVLFIDLANQQKRERAHACARTHTHTIEFKFTYICEKTWHQDVCTCAHTHVQI
jgi:hypothetical protein